MKYIGEVLIKISSVDGLEFLCWGLLIFLFGVLLSNAYQLGKIHSLEDDIKLQKFNELEEENRILKESIKIKKSTI